MWRLAGRERSTRFEPASQYSQLPLRVEQSRKTEGSQGGDVWTARKAQRWDAGAEQSNPGTGEEKIVFGRRTTHQEAGQETDSGV